MKLTDDERRTIAALAVTDEQVVDETNNMLAMWVTVEASYHALEPAKQVSLIKAADWYNDTVWFPGFDPQEEGRHYVVARVMVEDRHLFGKFKDRRFNCHCPVIDRHRRMLASYKQINRKENGLLSLDELTSVLRSYDPVENSTENEPREPTLH